MRVAFLSVSAEMGGSEASLLELVKGVRRLRPAWQPIVFVPRDGPLAARVRSAGGDTRVLPMPAALAGFGESSGRTRLASRGAKLLAAASAVRAYADTLASTITAERADVVHSNGLKLHVLASRALPREMPIVWHVHEYISTRTLSRTLLRRLSARPRRIVANSHSVAADVAAALGTSNIETIYNAVDLDEFAPAGDALDLDALAGAAPAPPGTVRIGLVATFGRWKGHEVFMRAVHGFPTDAPVRAYVIGGPLYDTGSQHSIDDLRREALRAGVADRVFFTGFVDRPSAALRALDVVVHASTQPEPFGLVIAEGMACGRAVVASAAGGAAELVHDGVDALTHQPGDAEHLFRTIQRLAADPDLRAALGRAARQTAEHQFAPDLFAGSFISLYERIAGVSAKVPA
jgi:glycosyltransferase involved in cell wall biosynthesis